MQDDKLRDSAGGKPSYNLRTLTRALQYCQKAMPTYGLKRALYDGLAMAFLTQLHPQSMIALEGVLRKLILGSMRPKDAQVLSLQANRQEYEASQNVPFWMPY